MSSACYQSRKLGCRRTHTYRSTIRLFPPLPTHHTARPMLSGIQFQRCNIVQFSVECERVVSPYIHRPRGLQVGGPMQLGVERDSHLYLHNCGGSSSGSGTSDGSGADPLLTNHVNSRLFLPDTRRDGAVARAGWRDGGTTGRLVWCVYRARTFLAHIPTAIAEPSIPASRVLRGGRRFGGRAGKFPSKCAIFV
ncbi:hypothetical protein J6590_066158 [Homalodisca vitripennis]|nr:hypothetical protein J6590_066158 [Homalodisca vitripennis]